MTDLCAIVRTEKDDGSYSVRGMPTSDFVVGVAYKLAVDGVIGAEEANTRNLARISFTLGILMARDTNNA